MSVINDLLKEADPIRNEPEPSAADRGLRRKAILAAASDPRHTGKYRSRTPIYLGVLLFAIVAVTVGVQLWPPFINDVQAAVRFEVRLSEPNPAPGLKEAKGPSGEIIYLHSEVIVTNSDIGEANVIPQEGGSQFAILITFNPDGARKVHAATERNIGKRLAILIDGEVITAPMIREATGKFAKIDSFTKAEAERIVVGMRIR